MPEMERPWPSPPDMRILRSPLGLGPCWVGRIWRHPRAGIFRRKRTDIREQAMRRSTASPRPDAPAILSGATPDPAKSSSIRWPVRARSGTWLGPSVGARFPSISSHDHRSEEHTSELQSHVNLVCRLLLEKKKKKKKKHKKKKRKKHTKSILK